LFLFLSFRCAGRVASVTASPQLSFRGLLSPATAEATPAAFVPPTLSSASFDFAAAFSSMRADSLRSDSGYSDMSDTDVSDLDDDGDAADGRSVVSVSSTGSGLQSLFRNSALAAQLKAPTATPSPAPAPAPTATNAIARLRLMLNATATTASTAPTRPAVYTTDEDSDDDDDDAPPTMAPVAVSALGPMSADAAARRLPPRLDSLIKDAAEPTTVWNFFFFFFFFFFCSFLPRQACGCCPEISCFCLSFLSFSLLSLSLSLSLPADKLM
jgi:hypothetical protein